MARRTPISPGLAAALRAQQAPAQHQAALSHASDVLSAARRRLARDAAADYLQGALGGAGGLGAFEMFIKEEWSGKARMGADAGAAALALFGAAPSAMFKPDSMAALGRWARRRGATSYAAHFFGPDSEGSGARVAGRVDFADMLELEEYAQALLGVAAYEDRDHARVAWFDGLVGRASDPPGALHQYRAGLGYNEAAWGKSGAELLPAGNFPLWDPLIVPLSGGDAPRVLVPFGGLLESQYIRTTTKFGTFWIGIGPSGKIVSSAHARDLFIVPADFAKLAPAVTNQRDRLSSYVGSITRACVATNFREGLPYFKYDRYGGGLRFSGIRRLRVSALTVGATSKDGSAVGSEYDYGVRALGVYALAGNYPMPVPTVMATTGLSLGLESDPHNVREEHLLEYHQRGALTIVGLGGGGQRAAVAAEELTSLRIWPVLTFGGEDREPWVFMYSSSNVIEYACPLRLYDRMAEAARSNERGACDPPPGERDLFTDFILATASTALIGSGMLAAAYGFPEVAPVVSALNQGLVNATGKNGGPFTAAANSSFFTAVMATGARGGISEAAAKAQALALSALVRKIDLPALSGIDGITPDKVTDILSGIRGIDQIDLARLGSTAADAAIRAAQKSLTEYSAEATKYVDKKLSSVLALEQLDLLRQINTNLMDSSIPADMKVAAGQFARAFLTDGGGAQFLVHTAADAAAALGNKGEHPLMRDHSVIAAAADFMTGGLGGHLGHGFAGVPGNGRMLEVMAVETGSVEGAGHALGEAANIAKSADGKRSRDAALALLRGVQRREKKVAASARAQGGVGSGAAPVLLAAAVVAAIIASRD